MSFRHPLNSAFKFKLGCFLYFPPIVQTSFLKASQYREFACYKILLGVFFPPSNNRRGWFEVTVGITASLYCCLSIAKQYFICKTSTKWLWKFLECLFQLLVVSCIWHVKLLVWNTKKPMLTCSRVKIKPRNFSRYYIYTFYFTLYDDFICNVHKNSICG